MQLSTRAAWLLGLALFATAWSLLHPPLPQLPNSDLFTHLSVAENLANGKGFVTHIVYPVSELSRSLSPICASGTIKVGTIYRNERHAAFIDESGRRP